MNMRTPGRERATVRQVPQGRRLETRRVVATEDIAWLQQDHRWPGLRSVAKVESRREVLAEGKVETETRYYQLATRRRQADRAYPAVPGANPDLTRPDLNRRGGALVFAELLHIRCRNGAVTLRLNLLRRGHAAEARTLAVRHLVIANWTGRDPAGTELEI